MLWHFTYLQAGYRHVIEGLYTCCNSSNSVNSYNFQRTVFVELIGDIILQTPRELLDPPSSPTGAEGPKWSFCPRSQLHHQSPTLPLLHLVRSKGGIPCWPFVLSSAGLFNMWCLICRQSKLRVKTPSTIPQSSGECSGTPDHWGTHTFLERVCIWPPWIILRKASNTNCMHLCVLISILLCYGHALHLASPKLLLSWRCVTFVATKPQSLCLIGTPVCLQPFVI